MKKLSLILILVILICTLTACGEYPDNDLTGVEWNKDWEMLGTVLGVEEVGNGFTLSQNASILTGEDTYYATWTTGEPTKWVNEDGEEVDLYPAQIYLMLYGCADEAAAKNAMADFISYEAEKYEMQEPVTVQKNGQEYTVYLYTCGSKTNPYNRGASAFARYQNYVICAELTCTERFDGDENALLGDFLTRCHYAAIKE